MSSWVTTKAELQNRIETLFRRLTGESAVSYQEKRVISDAINRALQEICMDYSIDRWRFLQTDTDVDTTSGTTYVDLDAEVFNIISGTVRIDAEDVTLSVIDLEYIKSVDPNLDQTGIPQMYALDNSSTANVIRLQLWPIPDAAYTIDMVTETMIDEDSISTFPPWLHGTLTDKSKAIALRDLGMSVDAIPFERAYDKGLKNAKNKQGVDVPLTIRRLVQVYRNNIQSRTP